MDPQTTWEEILSHYRLEQYEEARHSAEALLDWLAKGGFAPRTIEGLAAEDPLQRHVALSVIRFITRRQI